MQSRAIAAVVIAATGFSLGFIIVKAVDLPPTTIAFGRTWAGALLLLASLRWFRPGAAAFPRGPALRPVLVAGVAFGAHQMLFISASQQTSISIVTLLQGMQPLLVAVVSQRVLGERVPRGLLFASLAAVVGVAVVVLESRSDDSHSVFGDLLAVLNVFAFLAYFLACKLARSAGLDSLALTAWALFIAALVLTPIYAVQGQWAWPEPWQVGLVLFHAWVPGNGHVLVNWAHARIPAALSSVLLSLVPVLASIWAFLLFDEPYGLGHIAGTVIALAAIEAGRRAK